MERRTGYNGPVEPIEDLHERYVEHVRTLEARYAKALAETGFDAVVIHSGTPLKRTVFDDQYWPLRPTPEFQLWAPLTDPDAFIVVEPGKKTVLVWPESKSFWERPRAPAETPFLHVLDVRRAEAPDLAATLATRGHGKRVAWIGEDTQRAEALGFEAIEHRNPPALLERLDRGRTKKTRYEVACLAEANRLAALGHEAVRQAFAGGVHSELELHLVFLGATRQDDPETPYKNIVALDRNGAVLHHVSYGRDRTEASSLLLDAGATYLGYCSDITRTWAKPRENSGIVFANLLTAMEEMQKRLVAKITIGMPYEELHDESHRQVSALLKEAGIARGSVEEIDTRGISRAFYPHGLGHSLGLQTHDVGCASVKPRADNPFLRNTSRIEEGQTFTIEPGLYFIDGLLAELRQKSEGKLVDWNLVETLAPFGGIRIEDDVLVLERGVRNFTRDVLPVGGTTV